jgi:hypothetical protein
MLAIHRPFGRERVTNGANAIFNRDVTSTITERLLLQRSEIHGRVDVSGESGQHPRQRRVGMRCRFGLYLDSEIRG